MFNRSTMHLMKRPSKKQPDGGDPDNKEAKKMQGGMDSLASKDGPAKAPRSRGSGVTNNKPKPCGPADAAGRPADAAAARPAAALAPDVGPAAAARPADAAAEHLLAIDVVFAKHIETKVGHNTSSSSSNSNSDSDSSSEEPSSSIIS